MRMYFKINMKTVDVTLIMIMFCPLPILSMTRSKEVRNPIEILEEV